ncbi:MAG: corrinoid protein [Thermodesulfobacteriota bacterium]
MTQLMETLSQDLIAGQIEEVTRLTRTALSEGLTAEQVLEQGLLAGMDVVGRLFKSGEMYIPEVLRSAKAMREGMEILKPLLAGGPSASRGTLVIGTVAGDLHDIGKDLVAMMFEGAAFKVINLGVDIKPERFVEAVNEYRPNVLGLSALLTTTMPQMGETVAALKKAGLRDSTKIMVGGAPLTEGFARKIGADGYSPNAAGAVEKARELIKRG